LRQLICVYNAEEDEWKGVVWWLAYMVEVHEMLKLKHEMLVLYNYAVYTE